METLRNKKDTKHIKDKAKWQNKCFFISNFCKWIKLFSLKGKYSRNRVKNKMQLYAVWKRLILYPRHIGQK